MTYLEKCLFKFFAHFLGFLLFLLSCMSSLYIVTLNPLSFIWCATVFSYFIDCFFTLLIDSFAAQKLLSLMKSILSIFAFGIISKKSLSDQCFEASVLYFLLGLLHQYHPALVTISLYYVLNSGSVRPPSIIFFLKIILAIQGHMRFHMNFRIFFLFPQTNSFGIWIGIVLTLQFTLDNMDTLTTLHLPLHEHRKCFYLCLYLFLAVFYGFQYTSVFDCVVKFMFKYFI